jgi:hypothetical protein
MADAKSVKQPKIGLFLFWLLIIVSGGSIALVTTSLRIGQQNDTTYGNVYRKFVGSWGGEITIIPADFYFEEKYSEKVNDVETIKTRMHYVVPHSIAMNSAIDLDKKREGLITFNSFIVDVDNEYILTNNTSFSDNLFVKFVRPENASIIYDYLVIIDDRVITAEFDIINDPFVLLSAFPQNQTAKINIRFKTKGIDVFKYKLAVYNKYVIQSFRAVFTDPAINK